MDGAGRTFWELNTTVGEAVEAEVEQEEEEGSRRPEEGCGPESGHFGTCLAPTGHRRIGERRAGCERRAQSVPKEQRSRDPLGRLQEER